jgi:hypothetical protein
MRLPIWYVVAERAADGGWEIHCNKAGAAIGFTSTDKFAEFLSKIDVVGAPDELFLLVADLHRHGATHLCLDPDGDGSGGRLLLTLQDVLTFAKQGIAQSQEHWDKRRAAAH